MSLTSIPTDTWGSFPESSPELREAKGLKGASNVPLCSGDRADFTSCRGQNRTSDSIVSRTAATKTRCEDRCTARHDAEDFAVVRAPRPSESIRRGRRLPDGATTLFAGCPDPMDMTLDLVVAAVFAIFGFDVNPVPPGARAVRYRFATRP